MTVSCAGNFFYCCHYSFRSEVSNLWPMKQFYLAHTAGGWGEAMLPQYFCGTGFTYIEQGKAELAELQWEVGESAAPAMLLMVWAGLEVACA